MRILQNDLADFVKTSLLNIRSGCEQALQAGLIVELPLHVDFAVEVVQAAQAVTLVTETEGGKSTETTEAAVTVTRTEQAHNVVTVEDAVTDTNTVARNVEQDSTEGGSDNQLTTYDWGEY